MTRNRKIKLAEKFVKWLEKTGCKITVTHADYHAGIKIFEVLAEDRHGAPLNTICYTSCVGRNRSTEDCWAEILECRCSGQLTIDRFDLLGLGKAGSMEELELKLEILDAS